MSLGVKRILAVFLEKDSCKLLVYRAGGLKGTPEREFAGQISFSTDVVRDGFIADPAKFCAQIKMAFAQKDVLQKVAEVLCFPCPDKVFTKTLPSTDAEEVFIHGLPYFKEELIIKREERKNRVTYTAFEKKLIEDFQRPFLEAGKKITDVKSGANVLTAAFAQTGKYLLLLPLDKETVAVAAQDGEVMDLAGIKNEVLLARLEEFRAAHGLTAAPVFALGKFSPPVNLQVVNLAPTDIYDLIVCSTLKSGGKFKLPEFFSTFNKKYLLLFGAVLVGGVLTLTVIRNIGGIGKIGGNKKTEITSPVTPVAPAPAPVPEPNKADFPIRVLNGTLVTGEASKLAEKLKVAGYAISETKNATSAGFVTTKLRTTATTPEKLTTDLKTTLLADYDSVNLEPVATLSGNAKIEIIIGKKK